jgi:hypothetical protein
MLLPSAGMRRQIMLSMVATFTLLSAAWANFWSRRLH